MADIKVKNRIGAKNIVGARVWFSCHPSDFEKHFQNICDDILKIIDCSVCYTENMTESACDADFEADLSRCNLFVIPVTHELLTTKNRTMDFDLPYAKKMHIPVLPIMMEQGLIHLYSAPDKFGEMQYLEPQSSDSTEISYKDKLKKYLDSVLISKEMAKKIRSAFDAYIFLSYRKKDRRYANELMRLIHNNPECRDIAIWFDEFLTPGESFRENIEKSLDNCKLFTLLVTPRLFEKVVDESGNEQDNYIISTELPLARKQKEEKGTDIFAVEMESTDRAALSEINIENCVNFENVQFREQLLCAVSRIATTPSDTPFHNFLIGLAYLEGIDVEIDNSRAISLITDAAERGLPEARQKLIDIYSNGIGVERDYHKACKWKKKCNKSLWDNLKDKFAEAKERKEMLTPNVPKNVDFRIAREAYEVAYQHRRAYKFFITLLNNDVRTWCENQMELSSMYYDINETEKAAQVIIETIEFLANEKEFNIYSLYDSDIITTPGKAPLNTSYFDMYNKLIGYYISEKYFSLARKWQNKLDSWLHDVRSCYSNIARSDVKADIEQFMRESTLTNAKYLYQIEKYEDARDSLLRLIDEVIASMNSVQPAEDDLRFDISDDGIIMLESNNVDLLLDTYMRTPVYMDFLSNVFALLGETYIRLGKKKEAYDAFDESVAANKHADGLSVKRREIMGKLKMAELGSDVGDIDNAKALMTEIGNELRYMDSSTSEITAYYREYHKVSGEIALIESQDDATEHFDKSIKYAEELVKILSNIESIEYLCMLYHKMYSISKDENTAQKYIDAMYKLTKADALYCRSVKAREAMGNIYYTIYECCADSKARENAYDIFSKLSKLYPEEKSFFEKVEKLK